MEFVEARRTAGLNNAPPCLWSPTPPLELKEAPAHALSVNAGFVTFVIFPCHVEGRELDRTVWSLSTFHAYVSYHVKTLDRAKPGMEKSKKTSQNRSFKRLSLKDTEDLLKARDEMLKHKEEELENRGNEQEKLQLELKKLQKTKEFIPTMELNEEEKWIWNDKATKAVEAFKKELEEYNKSATTIDDNAAQS